MKIKMTILLIFLSITSLKAQKVEKIWGEVLDFSNQNAIENATIQIVGNPLSTKTDSKGNFSVFIENAPGKVTLRITKEDYERYELELSLPINQLIEIRLKKIDKPTISIAGAIIGSKIWGTINGIAPNKKYKMIAYLYTDKYYIHPWANSQQIISSNGEWSITSVRQPGPCPEKVLVAIVDINYSFQGIMYGPDDKFINWSEIDTAIIKCH
jgi:hypothetical protein